MKMPEPLNDYPHRPEFHRSDLLICNLRRSIQFIRNIGCSRLVGARNPKRRIFMNLVRRFVNDERGATAIEYGLIAAGISVAIIAVVNTLGTNLNTTFSSISSQLK